MRDCLRHSHWQQQARQGIETANVMAFAGTCHRRGCGATKFPLRITCNPCWVHQHTRPEEVYCIYRRMGLKAGYWGNAGPSISPDSSRKCSRWVRPWRARCANEEEGDARVYPSAPCHSPQILLQKQQYQSKDAALYYREWSGRSETATPHKKIHLFNGAPEHPYKGGYYGRFCYINWRINGRFCTTEQCAKVLRTGCAMGLSKEPSHRLPGRRGDTLCCGKGVLTCHTQLLYENLCISSRKQRRSYTAFTK